MSRFIIFAITFVFSIGLIGCASSPDGGKKPAANANTAAPAAAQPSLAENMNKSASNTDFGKSDADRTNDGKSDADRSNSKK